VNPALASMFPIPQKYYVPGRMRNAYFQRLVAAGLWKETTEEKPSESPFPRDAKPLEETKLKNVSTLSRAFDREKVQVIQATSIAILTLDLGHNECPG
jgi:sorting and assembly machinery component 37